MLSEHHCTELAWLVCVCAGVNQLLQWPGAVDRGQQLVSVEGLPCQTGLLDGPAGLLASLLAYGPSSDAGLAATQAGQHMRPHACYGQAGHIQLTCHACCGSPKSPCTACRVCINSLMRCATSRKPLALDDTVASALVLCLSLPTATSLVFCKPKPPADLHPMKHTVCRAG